MCLLMYHLALLRKHAQRPKGDPFSEGFLVQKEKKVAAKKLKRKGFSYTNRDLRRLFDVLFEQVGRSDYR